MYLSIPKDLWILTFFIAYYIIWEFLLTEKNDDFLYIGISPSFCDFSFYIWSAYLKYIALFDYMCIFR